MSRFAVNGTEINPSACNITYQDLDGEGTERNANGILVRQVIRRNVVKINIEFPPMTTKDIAQVIKLFDNPKFQFTYPDPLLGKADGTNTITAYCGDRSLDIKRVGSIAVKNTNGKVEYQDLYAGLKFSIIEY